jgi:hypothetical protein
MQHTLTIKEEQFLVKIIDWIAENRKSPTVREAQKVGSFLSSRTATQYLDQLEEKSFITRKSAPRSLQILIDPRDTRPGRRKPTAQKAKAVPAPPDGSVRPSTVLLVDATELDNWSQSRDAQAMLPHVIRRLIHATTDGTGTVEFRSGEGVQLPGYDGFTDFRKRTSFVPAGSAIWEVGTNGGIEKKAQADYRARTDHPGDLNPAKTTFVFVTSRRWREKNEWLLRRRADKVWRDVRVVDADDLHAWLELAPGIHHWFSRAIGKGADGAMDLATYALDWYEATNPALSSAFVLAGRNDAAEAVKKWLATDLTARQERPPAGDASDIVDESREEGALALRAETRDEAIAFFAAVVHELPEEDRRRHEVRAVVVANESAWQQLAVTRDPMILIPLFMPTSIVGAERNGHRVVLPLSAADRAGVDVVDIGPVDREALEPILKDLLAKARPSDDEVIDNKARNLAHLARRSVMALRRSRARRPELSQPAWASPTNGPLIALVMLAGAWKDKEGDREAVSRIVGMPYTQLERELVRWARETDAPVRRIGERWLVISKEDCWPLLHDYLTRGDLQRFHDTVVEILSAIDPRLELEPDKQWTAALYGHVRPHSGTLITALANSVALLGTRGDDMLPMGGESGRGFAASIVRTVLNAANDDVRVWVSATSVLSLLAEAAPSQFLDAIEKGLAGQSPVLRDIFTDKPGASTFGTTSPHVYLLWALERLAWAPEYLPRAATALAKLAVLDEPRGTVTNRPDASLRQLFLCWHPETHASLEKRIQVIDGLRKSHPTIAWRVLVSLLPSGHDFSMNHEPAVWRDWGLEPQTPTRRDVFLGYRQVISRVIDDVGDDPARWKDVIEKLEKIGREDALRAIEKLENIPVDRFDAGARETLSTALREVVALHRSHPGANWDLTADDIARLEAIHSKFAPQNLSERHRWLFTRAPELLDGTQTYSEKYNVALASKRDEALQDLFGHSGLAGAIAFALGVEMPNDVGGALVRTGLVDATATDIMRAHLASSEPALDRFARGFTFELVSKRGFTWAKHLVHVDAPGWSPEQRAQLLTFLPYDDDETWELLEVQDDAVKREYWRRMYPWGVPEARIEHLTRNLAKFGRPFTAADVLAGHIHVRSKKTPPPELLADILHAVLTTKETDDPVPSQFGYDLGELAESLAKEPGSVPLDRIAAIEWALVPFLSNHDLKPRILHGELVRNPSFFADIVALVYRPHDEEAQTESFTEDDRLRARAAYKLLDSCRTFPGRRDDGTIDAQALTEWVTKSRVLLQEAKRETIGDLKIGSILGTSPLGDDGLWPHEAVRDIVQTVESPEIERGIILHVYNSRGGVSKSLREGGAQERELVKRYRAYADGMNEQSSRAAALLREIAAFYESDARRSDVEVAAREHLER